jgi:hypothetical protein
MNLDTYNATMDLIRTNLEYLSDSTELFFAPAGEAMRTAWNDDQTTMLWGGNGDIHPNARGSYIIACAFYSSIFQKPSLGTNVINSLTAAEASSYQELADTTVLNHLSDWRINNFNQHTAFNYQINESLVTFTSSSQNIDSLHWDFGDGNTSNLSVVDHDFIQMGLYDVVLTTYKDGCVETETVSIDIELLELEIIADALAAKIYPNPFLDRITIENYRGEEIFIFNLLGQEFNGFVSIVETEKGLEINTTRLPLGTYVLRVNGVVKVVNKY